jgi:hypothetical protein
MVSTVETRSLIVVVNVRRLAAAIRKRILSPTIAARCPEEKTHWKQTMRAIKKSTAREILHSVSIGMRAMM